MALTGVTSLPRVVKLGGAWETSAYVDGGVFVAGDPIRVTNAGEIKVAALDSDTTGAWHGIALEARPAEVNTQVRVLMFAEDTEIAIQCVDAGAPEDILLGQIESLEGSSGAWGILANEVKGIVLVVDRLGASLPWVAGPGAANTDPYDEDVTVNNNSVVVRVLPAQLIGRSA